MASSIKRKEEIVCSTQREQGQAWAGAGAGTGETVAKGVCNANERKCCLCRKKTLESKLQTIYTYLRVCQCMRVSSIALCACVCVYN